MINLKRVTIATLSAIVFGVIFYWLICYPFGHIHPYEKLRRAAEKKGKSIGQVINELIERYL